jgi:type IV secretory pathway component VirB8
MQRTETNILNKMHNNHRILIDEITKIYNDETTTITRVCTVIRYTYDDEANSSDECMTATPIPFKVSPHDSMGEIFGKAKEWIDFCNCEVYNTNYQWIMFD